MRNGLLTKNLTETIADPDADAGVTTIAQLFFFEVELKTMMKIAQMTGYVIAKYKKTFPETVTKSGFLPTITPISLGII